jgi:hypothetical protein
MAKTESEVKLVLTDKERNDLKNSLNKLTENKIGFGMIVLTEDETKLIEFIKSDL